MHILANGAARNLRPTITNHLNIQIMIQNFDCRGQRMMERIIADRPYTIVQSLSRGAIILQLCFQPKICSQYDNCRAATEQLPIKYRYESKTDYLFKYDNCAWIYSDIANIHLLGKYEYYRNSAWNSLRNSACAYLEQYEKGQVVFP